ncbi:metallophosphoesterase family protein [Desertivirga arenae]|uniref:metallophosphoesterase family protein n=1 Tax=Desertivirga arenae TaxID=2810309 RepID=UPI001A96F782|nr:metallophosphoesterase [Pedobacter sp. SYSU D00823]
MKRRNFIQSAIALSGAATLPSVSAASPDKLKPSLTVAHITDVHIRDKEDIPERAKRYLFEALKNKNINFILNGGDSIFDASYDDVTKEMVLEQWAVWDKFIGSTQLEVFSCIGNHDPWWKAPSDKDEMYGVSYVAKRLKMPNK